MFNLSAKFDKETSNGLVSYRVHKVHAQTDGRNHGTTAALLYPHRNALRGDTL